MLFKAKNFDTKDNILSVKERLDYLNSINITKDLDENDRFHYYKFKGLALEELGNLDEALKNYEDAIKNFLPSKNQTENSLIQIIDWKANILEKQNKIEKALKEYEKITEIDSKKQGSGLLDLSRICITLGKYERAKKALEKLEKIKKDSPNYVDYWKKEIDKLKEKISEEEKNEKGKQGR